MQQPLVDCDDPDHQNQEASADLTGTNGFHGNNMSLSTCTQLADMM